MQLVIYHVAYFRKHCLIIINIYREKKIIWSDVGLKTISRIGEDGSNEELLVSNDIQVPGSHQCIIINFPFVFNFYLQPHLYLDGIAWDCTTSKLYWTDVGDHDIEVLDPATGNRTVLIDTGEDSAPRAIILDCEYRFDCGTSVIV